MSLALTSLNVPSSRRAPAQAEVLDALSAHVAVLDDRGQIVRVNESWRRFGAGNGWIAEGSSEGANYLDVCDSARGEGCAEAQAVAEAIREVLSGQTAVRSIEYPCHSATEERYFLVRVSGLEQDDLRWAVVSHEDITARRQAEMEVRSSEARFRSLIENSSDVITVIDSNGVIGYESPSAARVLGCVSSERLGQSIHELVHPADRGRLEKLFGGGASKTLEDPGAPLEFRCLHKDGGWRFFEGTAKRIASDPAAAFVINYRDITDRRAADEARSRLTAVVDWSPNFIGVADPRGRLSWANRATRELLRLSEDSDLPPIDLADLYPQWAADIMVHKAIPMAAEEGVWSGEMALLDGEGGEIPVLQIVLAHKTTSGCIEYFSTIGHDISERKRSEEALRESAEMFRQIAANINEMLWIFDLDEGRPVYVSPIYERIWGRPVESIDADPASFLETVSPKNRTRLGRLPNGTECPGRDEEFRIVRPDGTTRWLRGRSFPIADARGSVSRLVGLTEDISDRKQLETELRQAQRLEAIGSLAAGIAHEINTPVQYVGDNIRFLQDEFSGIAELLTIARIAWSEAAEGEPGAETLQSVRDAADRLDLDYALEEIPRAVAQSLEGVERVAEIVRAMKDFSHPGSSTKTPIDLNRAVQSTLTVARTEWKYVANLVLDLDPNHPWVPCYPSELNQALLNLIINAAHAIAETLGDTPESLGTLTVRTRCQGEWAEIVVEDSGTGIPDEIRSRVFDPFFTTKEVGRGTGQGLTLAHTVVADRHGGSLSFETEVGVGTQFVLRLPVNPADGVEEDLG